MSQNKRFGPKLEYVISRIEKGIDRKVTDEERGKIVELYNSNNITVGNFKPLVYFILYNLDNWQYRFEQISQKYKKDGFSIESLEIRYGSERATEIQNERIKKVKQDLQTIIKRVGNIEKATERWQQSNKKKRNSTLENHIRIHGEEKGLESYRQYHKKRSETLSKKTNWKDTTSLSSYIVKYGMEEGSKKYEIAKKNRYSRFYKEYYIEKFGEKEGIKKYLQFKEKHNKHMKEMSITGIKSKKRKGTYSEVSQRMFFEIFDLLSFEEKQNVKFGKLNGEEIIFLDKNILGKEYIFIDFKMGNKIIEFDCDYWHKPDEDVKRDNFLVSCGYKILRVDFFFYKKEKSNCIRKCLDFLQEKEG